MLVDLPVISSRVALIAKEVYLIELLQKSQAVSLIPPYGKYVEANLTTNRKLQPHIWEFFLQNSNEFFSELFLPIKLIKLSSFWPATVPADWANVEHPISVFDKCTSFHRDIHFGYVFQTEIDEYDQFFVTNLFF